MLGVLLLLGGPAAGQAPPADRFVAAPPAYLELFAPRLHRSAYRAYVSPTPLEVVLKSGASRPGAPDGGWRARPAAPVDAFGRAGDYNRWQLMRLYGSRRPLVARGAVFDRGRVVESWTLISPYPDPSLRRLEPGTLLLVLRIP